MSENVYVRLLGQGLRASIQALARETWFPGAPESTGGDLHLSGGALAVRAINAPSAAPGS
jgi:hypothetical protein